MTSLSWLFCFGGAWLAELVLVREQEVVLESR